VTLIDTIESILDDAAQSGDPRRLDAIRDDLADLASAAMMLALAIRQREAKNPSAYQSERAYRATLLVVRDRQRVEVDA